MCQHGCCLHGDTYARDAAYNKTLADRLYDELLITNKEKLHEIQDAVWKQIYENTKIQD
jgi:hypothetical protein